MARPKLIITADDYGMSPRFNQGMLEAARAGLVTSISVMIKRKYIRKSELLNLAVSLGLHLELKPSSSYREITSQIARFKKRFDRLPDYLDGHQHQHITPENIGHVIRAAQRYQLPVRSRLLEDRNMLRQGNVVTPDNFISWHPDRLAVLTKRLRETKIFPISELVVHPGYFDPHCRYKYNQERGVELVFLKSERFARLTKGFSLLSYENCFRSIED